MSALAREQRPRAAHAAAVEGRAVRVLAVTVAVVAVPRGAARRLHAEQRVGDLDARDDERIVRLAQAETHELLEIGADLFLRRQSRVLQAILDRQRAVHGLFIYQSLWWFGAVVFVGVVVVLCLWCR